MEPYEHTPKLREGTETRGREGGIKILMSWPRVKKLRRNRVRIPVFILLPLMVLLAPQLALLHNLFIRDQEQRLNPALQDRDWRLGQDLCLEDIESDWKFLVVPLPFLPPSRALKPSYQQATGVGEYAYENGNGKGAAGFSPVSGDFPADTLTESTDAVYQSTGSTGSGTKASILVNIPSRSSSRAHSISRTSSGPPRGSGRGMGRSFFGRSMKG